MNQDVEGHAMKKTLGILGLAALLALPGQALGQEGEQQAQQEQCELQPSAEATAAQQFLNQAQQDTTLAEEESRQLYQKAWGQLEGPIQGGTDDATLYVLGAQAQLGLRNFQRANELLNQFVELRPDCDSFAQKVRYSAWARLYNQAIRAYQGGSSQEALRYFVQASNIYKDARSLVNAATLYRQQGRLDTAAVLYEEVLASGGQPQRVQQAMTSLVQVRREQGNPELALEALGSFMAQNPDNVSVRINYAQALADAGQEDSAQAMFSTMLDQSGLSFNQWSQLGVGLYGAGNYEDAVRAFRNARELNPLNKEAMENLQRSLVLSEQYEAATSMADTLAAWYPYDAQNLSLAVRAFAQSGQAQRAKELHNRQNAMPIRFHQLSMASQAEGQYAMQGTVENVGMDQESVSLSFELLDESGQVVDTKDLEIGLPAQGETTQFQLEFQAPPGAVTFRYGTL